LKQARQGGPPPATSEKLLAEGVGGEALFGLGLRDLRGIGARAEVRTASWRAGEAIRLALCCGATSELSIGQLDEVARICQWQPKVAALQWANMALALPSRQNDSSASVICVCIRDRSDDECEANPSNDFSNRPAKKQKGMPGPRSVRVRHLLLRCADPGKGLPEDPLARRSRAARGGAAASAGTVRSKEEAEAELVKHLKGLLCMQSTGGNAESSDLDTQKSNAFRRLCQLHSECSTADNAGQLCGDLGWISRGQGDIAFEQAAFSLRKLEFSDVIATSRGLHLIQRLA